jgi:FixJ family two-component response regulator
MLANQTVFVIEDEEAVRHSLEQVLSVGGFKVETYARARDFLDAFPYERPGCLLLDIHLPDMTGFELMDELHRRETSVPVVMLTGYSDVRTAVTAMQAGAIEFIEKPPSPPRLMNIIKGAIELDRKRREARFEITMIAERIARLTQQERETLDLLYEGCTAVDIGCRLQIETQAAETLCDRVMDKMQVVSLAELVRMLVKHRAGVNRSEDAGDRYLA